MTTTNLIHNHPVYKQVLKESFGGVMYNVANKGKYDKIGTLELLALWATMPRSEKESVGGITKGAMNFLEVA